MILDSSQLYLRQLPDALLSIDSKERELISSSSDEEAFKMLSKKLRKMPPSHQATAKMLVAHFARVLNHSAANKMTPQALALCLNPVIFSEETSLSAFAQGHKVSSGPALCPNFIENTKFQTSLAGPLSGIFSLKETRTFPRFTYIRYYKQSV